MSLALCAPQSLWFSLNFALRKLFASRNWYYLRKRIFIKVHNTIPRMHEWKVEEVTQLVAFSLVFLSIILLKGLITQVHVCD